MKSFWIYYNTIYTKLSALRKYNIFRWKWYKHIYIKKLNHGGLIYFRWYKLSWMFVDILILNICFIYISFLALNCISLHWVRMATGAYRHFQ